MKTVTTFIHAAAIIATTMLASCTASDNFAGESGNVGAPKPATQKPATPQPQPSVPLPTQQCTQSQLTSIRSQRSLIDQRTLDRTLPMELTFQPCPSQRSNLQLPIKFDLDGDMYFPSQTAVIPYQLTINGTVVPSGSLQAVTGSDLFDNVGSQYVHFRSSQNLAVSPNLQTAILILDLRNLQLMGPANSSAPATDQFTVGSHIRVGDPAPVAGSITFTPAN